MTKPTVEHIAKANGDALAHGGTAALAGIQELAQAYQALAARNAAKLTESLQALSAVKTPTDFFQLQQRLISEGVAAAVKDSQEIAKLTTAVFTAAFEPVQKQIVSLQGSLTR